MESGLLRQRRNLIVLSCLLIVYNFADIKVKQVGLMGTSIEVGNPAALTLIIWVVWFYFFLRYYQYWSTERDANVMADLRGRTEARVRRYFKANHESGDKFNGASITDLARKRLFRWVYKLEEYNPGIGGYSETEEFDVPIERLMWWSSVEFFSYCFHKKAHERTYFTFCTGDIGGYGEDTIHDYVTVVAKPIQ